jgi:hypothetical protein
VLVVMYLILSCKKTFYIYKGGGLLQGVEKTGAYSSESTKL